MMNKKTHTKKIKFIIYVSKRGINVNKNLSSRKGVTSVIVELTLTVLSRPRVRE